MKAEPKLIFCEVDEILLENEDGKWVDGVEVTCPLCDENEVCEGINDESIAKCIQVIREECGCDNVLITN